MERTFAAPDEAALRADLEQQGYYLFQIQRGPAAYAACRSGSTKVDPQLAAALRPGAGRPPEGRPAALPVARRHARAPAATRCSGARSTTVRDKVKSGIALSEAFRAEGDLYPPIFAASLVAGERSGSLETVLRRFVQHLRLNQALKKKAIAASVYPARPRCSMMAALLVVVLLVFVIPQFQSFYEGLGAELPLPTRVLLAVATPCAANLSGSCSALGSAAVRRSWSGCGSEGSRRDRSTARCCALPYFGGLDADVRHQPAHAHALARCSRAACRSSTPSRWRPPPSATGRWPLAVGGATHADPRGREPDRRARVHRMLETLPLEMVKVGEQTGALGDMLNAVAEFYDEELDTRMATVLVAGRAGPARADGRDRGGDAARLLPADVPGDLGRPAAEGYGMSRTEPRRRRPGRGARRGRGGGGARAGRALPPRVRRRGARSRPTPRSCSRCRSS